MKSVWFTLLNGQHNDGQRDDARGNGVFSSSRQKDDDRLDRRKAKARQNLSASLRIVW